MFQQEHHKTEYHLCEVMARIRFCKLNIYQPFYFFLMTYYKSNLMEFLSTTCLDQNLVYNANGPLTLA